MHTSVAPRATASAARQAQLARADLVVPSLDGATEAAFGAICRPVPGLAVQAVIDGHKQLVNCHYESFLTGASRSKEINLKNFKPADKQLYDGSLEKEWSNWLLYRAVFPLADHEVKALGSDLKGHREEAGAYGQERPVAGLQEQQPAPHSGEVSTSSSRMPGEIDLVSYSPTASLLAFNLACAKVSRSTGC